MSGLQHLCIEDIYHYGTEFNIIYETFDGPISEEKIPLKFGENHLVISNERVSMTEMYTRWNSICYKINTTRKVDFRKTEIKLKASDTKTLGSTIFFFTSEENSFGVANNIFMDGKSFSAQLSGGKRKEIELSAEKNVYFACEEKSFFEYVASRLNESYFANCITNTGDTAGYPCLRTSWIGERKSCTPIPR